MRRPSYFQLRTGFVPDVPTPGVYPFPHLGCDQEAKEAPKCDTWITRTACCAGQRIRPSAAGGAALTA